MNQLKCSLAETRIQSPTFSVWRRYTQTSQDRNRWVGASLVLFNGFLGFIGEISVILRKIINCWNLSILSDNFHSFILILLLCLKWIQSQYNLKLKCQQAWSKHKIIWTNCLHLMIGLFIKENKNVHGLYVLMFVWHCMPKFNFQHVYQDLQLTYMFLIPTQ